MKLITHLFFFFLFKNENHERQNLICWWNLKILWVTYTLYTLSFLDFLEFLIKWINLVWKSVWLLLWVEIMTSVENWFLCSHKMAISFSLHPISPEKWRPCFSQALTDEILFVIHADCQGCLFQEMKQASLLPISVIKHLHKLLKHTLTQRNGQQI